MNDSIRRLPLTCLVTDPEYQPRVAGMDPHHLEQLRQSDPEDWSPLLVAPEEDDRPDVREDDRYVVIDGWHRVAVARELGLTELPCIVRESGGYPEAVGANKRHGLPLSTADRKDYARWVKREYPAWSYRQIGREAGLHHTTVKQALEGGAEPEDSPFLPSSRALSLAHEHKESGELESSNFSGSPEGRAIERLVRLLVEASKGGVASGGQQAGYVRNVIQKRGARSGEVAKILDGWGKAFVEAAVPFLTKS